MAGEFMLRRATVADAPIIARHRAEMFTDMGRLLPPLYDAVVAATSGYLEQTLPTEEYVGWLAAPSAMPDRVIAGAGVLQRRVPPHPADVAGTVLLAEGRQGVVLNVFTERPWQRHGLARLLMERVLAWAAETGLETLVLHASPDGRRLYESMGFVATNEMRYAGPLLRARRQSDTD